MTQTGTSGAPPADTRAWHALSVDDALKAQSVTIDQGLTAAEADVRRAKYGTREPQRYRDGWLP